MNEGKFKKWIKNRSVDGLFTEYYILEFIEEAKKEFPDVFKGVNEKLLSKEEFTMLLVKQNREHWNWFLKWFGE